MDTSSDQPESTVAWNSISLSLPESWTPITIEKNYLLFTNGIKNTLEIKWQREDAPASMQRKRKALEKQLKRLAGFSFTIESVPSLWRDAVSSLSPAFKAIAFTHNAGNGILCIHSSSNTTILLQTHGSLSDGTLPQIKRALASLTVTPAGAQTAYKMYDLACAVPGNFTISSHDFKPGHYSLVFQKKNTQITVERRSPANVVLDGSPFGRWVAKTFTVDLDTIRKDKSAPPQGAYKWYLWSTAPSKTFIGKIPLLRRLRNNRTYQTGAAWVVEDENKLLTVHMRSCAPIDSDTFESICKHVQII